MNDFVRESANCGQREEGRDYYMTNTFNMPAILALPISPKDSSRVRRLDR